MKKLLLILREKEMDRYKISFGTSFLHSIIVRVPAQWSKLWIQNNTKVLLLMFNLLSLDFLFYAAFLGPRGYYTDVLIKHLQ